jgi:hypothetical protein
MRLVALVILGIVVLRVARGILLVPLLHASMAVLPLTLIVSLGSRRPPASRLFAANLFGVLILGSLSAAPV